VSYLFSSSDTIDFLLLYHAVNCPSYKTIFASFEKSNLSFPFKQRSIAWAGQQSSTLISLKLILSNFVLACRSMGAKNGMDGRTYHIISDLDSVDPKALWVTRALK
jgi:hypothetical protein